MWACTHQALELKELIALHASTSSHGGDLKHDTVTIIGATNTCWTTIACYTDSNAQDLLFPPRNSAWLFIREVMRTEGDTLSTVRKTVIDTRVGQYVIPKGTGIRFHRGQLSYVAIFLQGHSSFRWPHFRMRMETTTRMRMILYQIAGSELESRHPC